MSRNRDRGLGMLVRAGAAVAAVTLLATGCLSFGTSSAPSRQSPASACPNTPKSDCRNSDCRKSGCPSGRPVKPDAATSASRGADPPGVGTGRSYRVGTRWMTFDEPAYTAADGSPVAARGLLTQIRYPLAGQPSKTTRAAKGPFPMIVYAPGFMQCGGPYSKLLRFWATAGYVVVVVNFPHSDCRVGAAATEADMLNQPRDMSYVITRMLRLNRARHGLFSALLNPEQIALAGQSDGGDTVAAIALNTCCTDHRVSAVAVESGAMWPKMRGAYFTRHSVPVLYSQGSADTINPAGCSVFLYRSGPSRPRYYLDLFGASHTGPYWGTNRYERVVARVTLAFFDRYVLKRTKTASAMRRQGNVPGLAVLFRNGAGRLPPAIPGPPCF